MRQKPAQQLSRTTETHNIEDANNCIAIFKVFDLTQGGFRIDKSDEQVGPGTESEAWEVLRPPVLQSVDSLP